MILLLHPGGGTTRASRWRAGALALSASLALAACGDTSESRRVADRFMTLYYDESRLSDAATLATGAAKARLDAEMQNIRGMAPPTPGERPHVTFRFVSGDAPSGAEVAYVYRVDLARQDSAVLVATLRLISRDGRWLVSELGETEKEPGS